MKIGVKHKFNYFRQYYNLEKGGKNLKNFIGDSKLSLSISENSNTIKPARRKYSLFTKWIIDRRRWINHLGIAISEDRFSHTYAESAVIESHSSSSTYAILMGTLISAYQWKQPERPVPNDTMDANWMMDAPQTFRIPPFPRHLKKTGENLSLASPPPVWNATFLLCDWSKMRFLPSFTVYFHHVFAILSPSIKFCLGDHFSWSGEIEFYTTLLVNCWRVWIIWR